MTVYSATRNKDKLREFRTICNHCQIKVVSVDEIAVIPEIVEDGETFTENAVLKATTAASITGKIVFADDSGLEVFAVNNEPGVHSARYAGPNATDNEKIQKLLHRLQAFKNRSARFVCVIAVASARGLIGTATGEVRGVIAKIPAGANGFGYDPIFIPDSHDRTFAQMTSTEKDAISHRGTAMRNALAQGLLNGT